MHINLGIVLLLYNLLLNECKQLDEQEGGEQMQCEREKLEQEWELSSLTLVNEEKNLRARAKCGGDDKPTHRQEAVMKGNKRENIRLSNVSDIRRKLKRKINIENCGSSNCYITIMHDVNSEWVPCDTCNKWYHMCEMLTPEEMSINSHAYVWSVVAAMMA